MRPRSAPKIDRTLLAAILALLGISVLMIYSTTAATSAELYGSSTAMVTRHILHMLAGVAVFLFALQLSPRFLERISGVLFGFAVLSLLIVLIPGLGDSSGGATRWLVLGPIRFQPGECAKLFVVLYFAGYISRHQRHMTQFVPGAFLPFAIVAAIAGLYLLEPDFGSSVILFLVIFCQLLTVSKISHLALIGVLSVVAASTLVLSSAYRMKRLQAFLDPTADASGNGYQLMQSLIAVGSGGLTGQGLGAGEQKLFYLPAAHTDFIFAVIAEELGFIGASAVLLLFAIIAIRGIIIARRLTHSPFLSSLALGLTLLLVIPALLNVGVVTGLLPTKGLVLPLVAYGGTAMIINLAVAGLLLRLSREEAD